jgi:hypothetical protein
MNGPNGGWSVVCDNVRKEASMHIEEDQVRDTERSHIGETVAFMAFENSFSYSSFSSGGTYESSGYLVSSAYDAGLVSSFQTIEWDETVPSCSPTCDIKVQVRTAMDSAGSPGTWTNWFGESGDGTYFDSPYTLIPIDLNGYQWIQYRVELSGDGNNTPVMSEIRVNYH